MKKLQEKIPEFSAMTTYPDTLWYEGDRDLLKRRKVSIVGTRRPLSYTKNTIFQLASALAKRKVLVVSGGAMGVDAMAHRGAGAEHTVAVMACGLEHRYPAVNASLLDEIAQKGLLLSQFAPGFKARPWSFVVRNELVVALGEVLVVGEAELDSGTMRSVAHALRMGKPIYVLPHRLGESGGTASLLKEKKAEAIYDIEAFAERFGIIEEPVDDPFREFCKTTPTYEEAAHRFGERLFEAELEGRITVREGRVFLL
ncbi:DNA-processing protein DprA [Hydrogenimonas sp.]